MEKDIFVHFNFILYSKIEKDNFSSILNFKFISKIEKQHFRFSFFKIHFILKYSITPEKAVAIITLIKLTL